MKLNFSCKFSNLLLSKTFLLSFYMWLWKNTLQDLYLILLKFISGKFFYWYLVFRSKMSCIKLRNLKKVTLVCYQHFSSLILWNLSVFSAFFFLFNQKRKFAHRKYKVKLKGVTYYQNEIPEVVHHSIHFRKCLKRNHL